MADLLVATLQDAARDALHGWQHSSGHSGGSATSGAHNGSGTSGSSVSDMLGRGAPVPAPMFPGNYESKDPVCLLGVRSSALQYIAVQSSAAGRHGAAACDRGGAAPLSAANCSCPVLIAVARVFASSCPPSCLAAGGLQGSGSALQRVSIQAAAAWRHPAGFSKVGLDRRCPGLLCSAAPQHRAEKERWQ
jgi:hypothetical protein